jgi:hypothetical protein
VTELTRERRKTVLDETSFQQLLAAAYVLQQHTDRLAGSEPQADPTRILSEIVEIQKLTEAREVDVEGTSQIIAERLHNVTTATGVAVGILEGGGIHYLAAVGNSAALAGVRTAVVRSLSADSLRNGKLAFGLRDSQNIVRSFPRGKNNSESFISVPFQHKGVLAGALELKFGQASAIPESDISAAQLMAGLMSDALTRADSLQQRSAIENGSYEAPQPDAKNGERLPLPAFFYQGPRAFEDPAEKNGFEQSSMEASSEPVMDPICHSCGHHFRDDEFFCGTCGLTRFVSESANNGLQSKWASLWYLQKTNQASPAKQMDPQATLDDLSKTEEFGRLVRHPDFAEPASSHHSHDAFPAPDDYFHPDWSIAPRGPSNAAPSAAAAAAMQSVSADEIQPNQILVSSAIGNLDVSAPPRPTLSGGDGFGRFWHAHRAEAYIGIAILLLIVALSGLGKTSLETPGPPLSAAARRKNPPKPKLTTFEQLLVGLGLAEPPPAPVYEGNPDTQVWVDLHTALYYCPGTDLFGATPKGQMTTQRSAQLDQFQPADRKPCD